MRVALAIALTVGVALGRFGPGVAHSVRAQPVANSTLPPIPAADRVARADRLALFRGSQAKAEVAFVGDSIVANAPWDELAGRPILNRGIGWDTSKDVLARLDEVLSRKPRELILWAGGNDLRSGTTPAQVHANIVSAANRATAAGAAVTIISVLPTGFADVNAKIAELNEANHAWAVGHGAKFISLDGVLTRGDFAADGIHPSATAYLKLAPAIFPGGRSDVL